MTELTPERVSEAEREIRQALALTSSRYVERAYEGLDFLLRAARERDELRQEVAEDTAELEEFNGIIQRLTEDDEKKTAEIARLREDVKALAEAAEDVPRILRANGMPGDYANVLAVKVDAALARPEIAALTSKEMTDGA